MITTGDTVEFEGMPTPAQAVAVFHELFPQPGRYHVERFEKAEAAIAEGFDEWFMRALDDAVQGGHRDSRHAIWSVLDEMLLSHGVAAPSRLDHWELQQALFDMTRASTARMVGFQIPDDVLRRLQGLHFTVPAALDFPAVAYRIGLIQQHLESAKPSTWWELRRLAAAVPLSPQEEAAVQLARQRAGIWLQPIYDETGRVWTAERELGPLREIASRALGERTPVREAARELDNSQRAQGVIRDAERVMRTELANVRNEGAWQESSKNWKSDTRLYRPTSANACRGCLRLYKQPNGMPRLYTRDEVLAADALGWNKGNWREWHARIGATHPNCACGPFSRWLPTMQRIFEERAKTYAEQIEQLKIFQEAA